ncbi:hypothetical protein LY78DRAFT_53657 [Colletotrichum sublineola]|nr:hypothetical protein LY78DRAFT_53657 [Colletotrichum sublineola]
MESGTATSRHHRIVAALFSLFWSPPSLVFYVAGKCMVRERACRALAAGLGAWYFAMPAALVVCCMVNGWCGHVMRRRSAKVCWRNDWDVRVQTAVVDIEITQHRNIHKVDLCTCLCGS